ncbi:phosphatase PAP2 family protein [Desulfoscipio geothermicus]|uniref:Undecaprenyl-diphosphatase n=1 Tax=Desulfoscipio geothermicus DSM 3669 TaxID=1121426 RepID=A0A1I6DY83_9FIRM|nr:phosphatase PAP2 family protein [Desulfoscipio geothermicus]SFR10386.1 undecaprenyl-diphosphatase [Desulfoscipio geothermicus DSM 3669]
MLQPHQKPVVKRFPDILPVLLLTLFFNILAWGVVTGAIAPIDRVITDAVRYLTSPQLTASMKFITFWGNTGTLWIIVPLTIIAVFLLGRRLAGTLLPAFSVTGGWVLTEALKWLFHRPRPNENPLVPADGFSFPSGHALMAVVFYGAIAYLLFINLSPSALRRLVTAGLALLILLIGISRVYLGVHYPSDVLAGFVAGGAWLITCVIVIQKK